MTTAREALEELIEELQEDPWVLVAQRLERDILPLLGTQSLECANCEADTFACSACGARLEDS